MNILCVSNDTTVKKACHLVEKYFCDDYIDDNQEFNYSYSYGKDVKRNTERFKEIITVKHYTTWNRWSKVIGYSAKNVIYVNTRKLDLPLKDRVENIRHEIFHSQGYSHNGNRVTEFNLKTVPYLGASLFVKYLESIGVL
jgi:hypothetical protein